MHAFYNVRSKSTSIFDDYSYLFVVKGDNGHGVEAINGQAYALNEFLMNLDAKTQFARLNRKQSKSIRMLHNGKHVNDDSCVVDTLLTITDF